MQFMEDYSEPQPSVFYQMPQSESIYEQRNKRFQEVYGFNDSFSSTDSVHEPLQPPALPPKQRQLVREKDKTCYFKNASLIPTTYKLPGLKQKVSLASKWLKISNLDWESEIVYA